MTKHKAPRAARPLGIAYFVVIIALVVAASILVFSPPDAPDGDDVQRLARTAGTPEPAATLPGQPACTPLTVVSAASFAPVLDAISPALAEGPGCVTLTTQIADGRSADDGLAAAGAHVWLPDDVAWLSGADRTVLDDLDDPPVVVATSPLYLVANAAEADRLAAASATGVATWDALATILTDPGTDPIQLVAAEPGSAGEGLLGVAAISEGIWQRAGRNAASSVIAAAHERSRAADAGAGIRPADGEVAVASECTLLAQGAERVGTARVLAPADHTAMLRYPWVPTTIGQGQAAVDAARQRLLQTLTDGRADEALAAAGLRGADMAAPDGAGMLPSTDAAALAVLDPHHFEHVFATWYATDRIADLLIAVDVSGSMWAKPPDSDNSLITEVKRGVQTVTTQLPDEAQLGVWEFGTLLDPPRDHRVVSPLAPLTAAHRSELLGAVDAINAQETGTGLHDTILAAYQAAQQSHRPGVRSQVLVFSDGRNESDPGSLTLEQLGAELSAAADPERPVQLAVVLYGVADELAAQIDAQIKPVNGYTSVVRSASDVSGTFTHLIAGGIHS